MRPLFLNENLGGHATVHANLRTALGDFPDVEPDFVDIPSPGLVRRALGVRVPGLAGLDLDLQPLRFQLAASWTGRRALRAARGAHDVLHVYSHTAGWLLQDVLRSMPSVVATDATNQQNMGLRPYRRPSVGTGLTSAPIDRIERRVLAAATLVVAQSQWAARALSRQGVEDDRLRLVRYGVPLPASLPERTPTPLPEITFVGKTMGRKGGLLLLDVFRERFRGRARLNLVTTEPVAPDVDVHVHGDIRPGDGRLAAVLARSAVFVLPTDTDMSPNAIIEAMSFGLPVVSTDVAAIPELVLDGVTGRLVPPRDGAALAAALEAVLADPEGSRAMGTAGYERARRLFDVRVTTRELVDVLRLAQERFRG